MPTPKRKNPSSPSSPPKTPTKSAKHSSPKTPKTPTKSAKPPSPKTKIIEKVFSEMSIAVTSPIRQKKAVRNALNLTHRNITESAAKAVQNAKRRAQLTRMMKEGLKISIRKPPQLRENEKRKTNVSRGTNVSKSNT